MVLHDAFSLKYLRVHHFLDPQSCFGSFFYYPNMDGIQRAPILTHEHFRANTSAQSSSNHCELFAQSDSKNVSSGTSKYLQIVAPRPLVLRGTRSHISTGDRFFFFGCNYFILYYAVYTCFLEVNAQQKHTCQETLQAPPLYKTVNGLWQFLPFGLHICHDQKKLFLCRMVIP